MFGKLCYSTVNSTNFSIFWKKKINQNFEKKRKRRETLPQLHTPSFEFKKKIKVV
jgi:hypothetical protein